MKKILKNIAFLHVASCGLDSIPNAAAKFLLKYEDGYIYLVDYVISKTWKNLKVNPKVSVSFINDDTLIGYQINGRVQIIENGILYNKLLDELNQKAVSLSASRILDGLDKGKMHKNFEIEMTEKFVIFKIKVEEVVKISPTGRLEKTVR